MGLDILSILLVWIAVQLQMKKRKDVASSLDYFWILILQILLIGTAFITMKSNPFPS